jgi:hypothetical protein
MRASASASASALALALLLRAAPRARARVQDAHGPRLLCLPSSVFDARKRRPQGARARDEKKREVNETVWGLRCFVRPLSGASVFMVEQSKMMGPRR